MSEKRKFAAPIADLDETNKEEKEIIPAETVVVETGERKSAAERVLEKQELKRSRPTMEETHVRATFMVRRDLRERLDRLARGQKGFKTETINIALSDILDELEAQEERLKEERRRKRRQ